MNTIQHSVRQALVYQTIVRLLSVLFVSLLIGQGVKAEIIELSITGYWSEKDFRVTGLSDKQYNPADAKFDGKVFGKVPFEGSVTIQLIVNTEGSVFFQKGSQFTTDRTGTYSLAHDFYGYQAVTLAGDTHSFGSAIWKSAGILTGLEGPGDTKAALWTDTDLTKQDPSRVSFRMFGKAEGLSADLFVGSRIPQSIGMQFLLWEYYKGEEIRSRSYSANAKVIRQTP